MATVRSISPGKSPDRLLNRRLARPPTAVSQRKITLTKTTPISVTTTVKRRKSSRTSSKKHSTAASSIPVRVNSFAAMSNISANDDLIEQMASTTIEELPPIRRVSRASDTPSITTEIFLPQIDSDAIIDDQQHHEEPLNDTAASNHLNETYFSSSSQESPAANIEFTIDAFDTVRTVGTGKKNDL